MILINKNANTTFDLSLREKSTLTTPFYLFVFTNDLTKSSVAFTTTDTSGNTQRYNRFLVTETSGTNTLTSGVITLNPTGFWHYKVYEQVSSSNLLVSATTTLVEEGKVNVVGTSTTHSAHSTTKTYKGYGKGAT
jgi:hypothetical protein